MAKKFRAGSTIAGKLDVLDQGGPAPTVFNVRQRGYSRFKEKAPSGKELFSFFAMDFVETESKWEHAMQGIELPALPSHMAEPANGVPSYFVTNVMIPMYDPPNPVWGKEKTDGPGYSCIAYFIMNPDTRAELLDPANASEAVRLLKDFIQDDSPSMRDRFKCMCNMLNQEDLDSLGAISRKMVKEYNMKPVLTRPQHKFFSDNKTYFEVDVDVHIFNYFATRTLSTMRGVIPTMFLDIGLVIEGKDDEELPERSLGVFRAFGMPNNRERHAVTYDEHEAKDAADRISEMQLHAELLRAAVAQQSA